MFNSKIQKDKIQTKNEIDTNMNIDDVNTNTNTDTNVNTNTDTNTNVNTNTDMNIDVNMTNESVEEDDSVMNLLSYNVDQIRLNNNNFVYLDDTHILSYNKKNVPVKSKYKNIYCVNCGEKGHVVKDCFGPITSFGIIAFKMVSNKQEEMYDKNSRLQDILDNVLIDKKDSYPKTKFLMIQRKDTMGYTDFVRGKYPDDKLGIESVLPIFLNEMTQQEKHNLLRKDFNEIWKSLWVNHDSKCFKNEYDYAYKKFQRLNIPELIKRSNSSFDFQEFAYRTFHVDN
jgi:hypothetical protein